MFSGIVETTGRLLKKDKKPRGLRLQVKARAKMGSLKVGQSIAVNGVCLTVVGRTGKLVSFDVVPETVRCSNLGDLAVGDRVNLERSLRYGDPMDGHYVLGHAEGTGEIARIDKRGGEVRMGIRFPSRLGRTIISKGSIAVDGVSLTVASIRSGLFEVCLVPHTLRVTNFRDRRIGDHVNLETDILLKVKGRSLRFHPLFRRARRSGRRTWGSEK